MNKLKTIPALCLLTMPLAARADFHYPVEGLLPGNIIGQDGWTKLSGTAPMEVDTTVAAPGSTQSLKMTSNGALFRFYRNFSGNPTTKVTLDKTTMYIFSFETRASGFESLKDGDFKWTRMQFMPQNAPTNSQVARFGNFAVDQPLGRGWFPGIVRTYPPDSDAFGLWADYKTPLTEEWHRFTYTFDMVHKYWTGPRVDRLTPTFMPISSYGEANWFLYGGYDPVTFDPLYFFDTVECMRFGMDAYAPGLTSWFDNISFVKAPGISGAVILNAPGTASPYLGEPKDIHWQIKAYSPLPDNNLLTDYPMAVDNNLVFHSSAPQGVSDIYVKGDTFLSAKYPSASVGGVGTFTNLGTIQVYNGDANGDDVINTDDYLIFNNAFDTTWEEPNFDARADFNGDQFVGTDDYLILSENFGMQGDLITDGR